jgi:hypothetical protein
MMRTQLTFLVSSIFRQWNISECNSLQEMKTTWIERDSTAQLPRYNDIKVATLCVKTNWKSLNFLPGPSAESKFKLDLFYNVCCNGAVWTLLWSSISIIRARAVQWTSSLCLFLLAYNCHLTCPAGLCGSQAEQAWQWFRVCPADSDSDQGRTVSLSDLVLNLTA